MKRSNRRTIFKKVMSLFVMLTLFVGQFAFIDFAQNENVLALGSQYVQQTLSNGQIAAKLEIGSIKALFPSMTKVGILPQSSQQDALFVLTELPYSDPSRLMPLPPTDAFSIYAESGKPYMCFGFYDDLNQLLGYAELIINESGAPTSPVLSEAIDVSTVVLTKMRQSTYPSSSTYRELILDLPVLIQQLPNIEYIIIHTSDRPAREKLDELRGLVQLGLNQRLLMSDIKNPEQIYMHNVGFNTEGYNNHIFAFYDSQDQLIGFAEDQGVALEYFNYNKIENKTTEILGKPGELLIELDLRYMRDELHAVYMFKTNNSNIGYESLPTFPFHIFAPDMIERVPTNVNTVSMDVVYGDTEFLYGFYDANKLLVGYVQHTIQNSLKTALPSPLEGYIGGVAPTTLIGKGSIKGTDTSMEYKAISSNTWLAVPGTTIMNLAPGQYHVRYKETTMQYASEPIVVTVPVFNSTGAVTPPTVTPPTVTPPAVTPPAVTPPVNNIINDAFNNESALKWVEQLQRGEILGLSVEGLKAELVLSNEVFSALKLNNSPVSISVEGVQYHIPTSVIASMPNDVDLKVVIEPVSNSKKIQIETAANKKNMNVIVSPVNFEMFTISNGKETPFYAFESFVSRTFELPTNSNLNENLVGVVIEDDMSLRSVPTVLYMNDGKYYAKLNSLSNSVYTVVQKDVQVASAKGRWSEAMINEMASKLVLQETESFIPNKQMTRADFAVYLSRALGLAQLKPNSEFKDTSADNEVNRAIASLANQGLISGYPDGTFRPNHSISRLEMGIMTANIQKFTKFQGSKQSLSKFMDTDQIKSWANAFLTLVEYNIYKGYPDNTLRPLSPITHEEGLQVIYNALKNMDLY